MNAFRDINSVRCNSADVRSVCPLARELHAKAPYGAFCHWLTTCIPEDKDKCAPAIASRAHCQGVNHLAIAGSDVLDLAKVFLGHNQHW
jgi:hypothetical protein